MDVNKWFLSLPPERQAVLREDKWMLANAAAQAATEAEREACGEIANKKAADVLAKNTYRGRANSAAVFAAGMLEDIGLTIRQRSTWKKNAEIV